MKNYKSFYLDDVTRMSVEKIKKTHKLLKLNNKLNKNLR